MRQWWNLESALGAVAVELVAMSGGDGLDRLLAMVVLSDVTV